MPVFLITLHNYITAIPSECAEALSRAKGKNLVVRLLRDFIPRNDSEATKRRE